jgi:alkaline phosphatase D
MQRRGALSGLAAAGFAAAGFAGSGWAPDARARSIAVPRRPGEQPALPERIAFGSCARQDKPQPIWEAVLAQRPDLFVFLGDNVYGDTRDTRVLASKYAALGAQPGFQALCAAIPIVATWDDHDYGEDDAGAEYPMKEASRRQFCDFWGEPRSSVRRQRDGIYDALTFEAKGRRLQLILPDLRFNRTPLHRLDLGGRAYKEWSREIERRGAEVPGPYQRQAGRRATMLGENQWRWLETELTRPADVRILASSLQVVADFPGWEAWINYAGDHERLLAAIRRASANGLVCISGDTHYGELSRLQSNAPYPLYDLTSSGLTETWPVTPPNALREQAIFREPNFGLIEIDWSRRQPVLQLQVRDARGVVQIQRMVDTRELVVS